MVTVPVALLIWVQMKHSRSVAVCMALIVPGAVLEVESFVGVPVGRACLAAVTVNEDKFASSAIANLNLAKT